MKTLTHLTLSGIGIILLNIPRHPQICHFTFLSFTNKNISGRQVTMDYLKESYVFLQDDIRLATTVFPFPLRALNAQKKKQTNKQTNIAMPFSEGNSKSLLGILGIETVNWMSNKVEIALQSNLLRRQIKHSISNLPGEPH